MCCTSCSTSPNPVWTRLVTSKNGALIVIWPFRKILHSAGALTRGWSGEANDLFYVSRLRIEKAIAAALAQGDNLVIYGPAHQGKTMLLARQIAADDSIYIECRPGFKRTQIYRVLLSSLGYAVLVEKKKRGKASTTVKLGLASTGVEARAEGELEQVMQSVTVDLKNPSEVAHLISRIKHLPWIVINNFQLLDSGTKRNLLFDMIFLTERPNIRIIIVGTWSNEDYLEEIEPGVAGKFRYVLVPTWSDAELCAAAAQWSSYSKALGVTTPRLEECLALAAGDISLFRALVESSIDKGESASRRTAPSTAVLPIQIMVLERFRRGLSTKLKAIMAQRETYLTYLSLEATNHFGLNPKFHPIPNVVESDYLRTSINPYTNRPYSDGRVVLLDRNGNPQYIEQTTGEVVEMQTDIACFLLRKFHSAVQQGSNKMGLTSLAHEFGEQLLPKPIALDESRLKAVFARFDEVQRRALIVPPMLAVDSTGDAIEIVDRRLTLFLQSVSFEDLEELLDEVQPRVTPAARRRNHVSLAMTEDEKAAYITRAMPEPQAVPSSEALVEGEPSEVYESGSNDEPETQESQ